MNTRAGPAQADVGPDTPLRLADAATLAFPFGGMKAAGLRREASRGRLAIWRMAGKDYTTLAAIEEMRGLCQIRPKERACGSDRETVASARSGSSATGQSASPQDALRMVVMKLKGDLPSISPKHTGRSAKVVTG